MSEITELDHRVELFAAKLDTNTEITRKISTQLEVHAKEHEAIKQHIEDTRRTLYIGTDKEPGLVTQARDCFNYRALRGVQSAGWPLWVAAAGGVVAAFASLALVLVEIFAKH